MAVVTAPIDFLGVNYYNPMRVRPGRDAPLHAADALPARPVTAMGWEIDPDGLRRVLARVRKEYSALPVHITENGAAFDDGPARNGSVQDRERRAYLAGHLDALAAAMREGSDVRGYHVWSLLDNFEWEEGYGKRFGIVHVDFATQRRTPKASACFYRDFIDAARGRGEGYEPGATRATTA
jgi:beta-glucosidase